MAFNGLFHLSNLIKREMMVKTRFPLNAKTCQVIISFTVMYTINAFLLMICRQIKKKKGKKFINLWKIFKYQRKYPLLKKYSLHKESSKSFVGTFPEVQKYIFNDTIRKWEDIALKKLNSPFLLYLSWPTSQQLVFSRNIWKHYAVKLLRYCI